MNEENVAKPKYTKTLSMISNKPEGREYKVTISNKLYWVLVMIACVLVGIVFGFLTFGTMEIVQITNEKIMQNQEYLNLQDRYAELQYHYNELVLTNENLLEQVQVLSDTINKYGMEDEAAAQAEAAARIPSGFPVTGSATEAEAPKDAPKDEQASYFEAGEHSTVVATAVGEVISVRKNAYDNYEICIDHGNDYISIFTNAGYPMVEEGTAVLKGTPLFFVQENNTLLKYQISFQKVLMNVYDVMNISG